MMTYNNKKKQQSVVLFYYLIFTEKNVKMIDGGIPIFKEVFYEI